MGAAIDTTQLLRRVKQLRQRVPVFLRPIAFVVIPVIVLHPLWTLGTSDRAARNKVPSQVPTYTAPPRKSTLSIPFAFVRHAVEKAKSFKEPKQAVCPRMMSDNYSFADDYPAIDALNHFNYLTTTAGYMQNLYELSMEGRLDLMSDTVTESNRYVITIARRAYDSGTEEVLNEDRNRQPLGPAELCVKFRWHWQPTNKVGTRLNLSPPDNDRKGFEGWATFRHHREGWDLVNLQLENDPLDYMQRQ